jgi:hypothetical protein
LYGERPRRLSLARARPADCDEASGLSSVVVGARAPRLSTRWWRGVRASGRDAIVVGFGWEAGR